MTTQRTAPTGAITFPIQFTKLRNAPSGWAAVWPWTARFNAGWLPRFCAYSGIIAKAISAAKYSARICRLLGSIFITPPNAAGLFAASEGEIKVVSKLGQITDP